MGIDFVKEGAEKTLLQEQSRVDTVRPKPQLLTNIAFETLKSDIIKCRLRPGSEITEAELCDRLSLGKAPVRGALARLHQVGLVKPIPRHGYLITPITLKGIQNSYELRLVLEPAVARLAAGRANIDHLRELNAKPGEATDEEEKINFIQKNRDFHVAIAVATGNQRMVTIVSNLLDDMARLIHLGLFAARPDSETSYRHDLQAKQHQDIIEALEAGDAAAAEAAARIHVMENRKRVLDAITAQEPHGVDPIEL